MNYLIQDTTLVGIADAVRGKGGTSDPIAVKDLATAITNLPSGGGGGAEVEPIVLSGTLNYGCSGAVASAFIENFPDKVSTKDVRDSSNMFLQCQLSKIPFEINYEVGPNVAVNYMFSNAKITEVPKMNNLKPSNLARLFNGCQRLREIPENIADTWDWSFFINNTSAYSAQQDGLFAYCYSLRRFPHSLLAYGNPVVNYSYGIYTYLFSDCYALDEALNIPIPHTRAQWSSNAFYSMVNYCYHLKGFTFALNEGVPYSVNWKNQTLDFTTVGYSDTPGYTERIYQYNSGIAKDKQVTDDASYQALKDDPDWFTGDIAYSRYNHDSAVETINSLPDTTISGGTNTIKFKGAAGAKTDGGAINTLTAEEIAVAAAKGWTVSLV